VHTSDGSALYPFASQPQAKKNEFLVHEILSNYRINNTEFFETSINIIKFVFDFIESIDILDRKIFHLGNYFDTITIEVANCDPSYEGEWYGEWEKCSLGRRNELGLWEIKIKSDNMICNGISSHLIRASNEEDLYRISCLSEEIDNIKNDFKKMQLDIQKFAQCNLYIPIRLNDFIKKNYDLFIELNYKIQLLNNDSDSEYEYPSDYDTDEDEDL